MWYEIRDNYIYLYIKAQPNSSKTEFREILEDCVKLKINAQAIEGEANRELIKFLAKLFKVSKSEVEIISGEISKRKKVKLPLNIKIENFIKEKHGEGL